MSARPLSTALKCFELLDIIGAESAPVRLAEMTRAIGESRATTYQRLLTLTAAGWLERLPDGRYRLSLKACSLANASLEQAGFGERARPVLETLTEQTQETSSLVILEGNLPVIAQRVEARGVLRADLRVGAELSFSESASGQVITAFGSRGFVERLRRENIDTASDKVLAKVRKDGYAIGGGGITLAGISVVAAPVLDTDGSCLASVSLVGPKGRLTPKLLIPALKNAAGNLAGIYNGV